MLYTDALLVLMAAAVVNGQFFTNPMGCSRPGLGLPGTYNMPYPRFSGGLGSLGRFGAFGGSGFVSRGLGNGGVVGGFGGIMNGGFGGGMGLGRIVGLGGVGSGVGGVGSRAGIGGLGGDAGLGGIQEPGGSESVGGLEGAGGGPGGLNSCGQLSGGLGLGGAFNPLQAMGLQVALGYPSYGSFGGFPMFQRPGIADSSGSTGAFGSSQLNDSSDGSSGSSGASPGSNGYQGNGYSGFGSLVSSSDGRIQNDNSQGGFSNGETASSPGSNRGSTFFSQPSSSFGMGFPCLRKAFVNSPYSPFFKYGPQLNSCSSSLYGQSSFPKTNVNQASAEPGAGKCQSSSGNQLRSCTPEPVPEETGQSSSKNVYRRSSRRVSTSEHGFNYKNR